MIIKKCNGVYITEKEASDAYWISNKGKIITVNNKHINTVLNNPESFGLSEKEINDTYVKYNEPRGLEGKAREEIMSNLLDKGYIRLRYNKRKSSWVVQLKKLSNKERDYLQQWANELIDSKYQYADVVILTNTKKISHSLKDVSNDILYNENTKCDGRFVLEHVRGFSENDKEIHESLNVYNVDLGETVMIFESGLSKVWRHSRNGFFMMSSFMKGLSMKDNLKRHDDLKKFLKSKRLGYFVVDGVYTYQDGTQENELFVFVPFDNKVLSFNEFYKIVLYLVDVFKQESILLKKPDGDFVLVYGNGNEDKIGSNIGFEKTSFAYSKIRGGSHDGKTFTIEGYQIPQNHISALSLKYQGIIF